MVSSAKLLSSASRTTCRAEKRSAASSAMGIRLRPLRTPNMHNLCQPLTHRTSPSAPGVVEPDHQIAVTAVDGGNLATSLLNNGSACTVSERSLIGWRCRGPRRSAARPRRYGDRVWADRVRRLDRRQKPRGQRPASTSARLSLSTLIWRIWYSNTRIPEAISVQHLPHCGFNETMFDRRPHHHFHQRGVVEWESHVRLEQCRISGPESYVTVSDGPCAEEVSGGSGVDNAPKARGALMAVGRGQPDGRRGIRARRRRHDRVRHRIRRHRCRS